MDFLGNINHTAIIKDFKAIDKNGFFVTITLD